MGRINDWLVDENFFVDKPVAFKNQCHQINKFLSFCPSPILVSCSSDLDLHFKIGAGYCAIPYNEFYSKYEIVKLVHYWAQNFYPSYTVKNSVQRDLTVNEIASLIQKGEDPDTVWNRYVEDEEVEKGLIEKAIIREDQLVISVEKKTSGGVSTQKDVYTCEKPISIFLKELRYIRDQSERKAFIQKNVHYLNELPPERILDVNYEGAVLMMFIKIWMPTYFDHELIERSTLKYRWGKFDIHFSNQEQLDFFYKYREEFKEEYKSGYSIRSYLFKKFGIKIGGDEKWSK